MAELEEENIQDVVSQEVDTTLESNDVSSDETIVEEQPEIEIENNNDGGDLTATKQRYQADVDYDKYSKRLNEIKREQEKMRREAFRNGDYASLTKNRKYKKLVKEHKNIAALKSTSYFGTSKYASTKQPQEVKNLEFKTFVEPELMAKTDATTTYATPQIQNLIQQDKDDFEQNKQDILDKAAESSDYKTFDNLYSELDEYSIKEFNTWASENNLPEYHVNKNSKIPAPNQTIDNSQTPVGIEMSFGIEEERNYQNSIIANGEYSFYQKDEVVFNPEKAPNGELRVQLVNQGYTLGDFMEGGRFSGQYVLDGFIPYLTGSLTEAGYFPPGTRPRGKTIPDEFDFGVGFGPSGEKWGRATGILSPESLKVGPNGEIDIQPQVNMYKYQTFLKAIGADKEFEEVNWKMEVDAAARVDKIIFDRLQAPENAGLVMGLLDNAGSDLYDDWSSNIYSEEIKKYYPDKMLSFTAKEKLEYEDGTIIEPGTSIIYSEEEFDKIAEGRGITVEEYKKELSEHWDYEDLGKATDENAPVKSFNDVVKSVNGKLQQKSDEAIAKGISYFIGKEFNVDPGTWLYRTQQAQGDIKVSQVGKFTTTTKSTFGYDDVEILQTLEGDQFLFETITSKDERDESDNKTIEALKQRYNVDSEEELTIISERRAKLIEKTLGTEFLNDGASLLFDPLSGDLYRKGKSGTVTNTSTGEEVSVSSSMVDYRMYLKNAYQGTDIESEILRTYIKLQALANTLGDEGMDRGQFASTASLAFFNALYEMGEEIVGLGSDDANKVLQDINDPNAPLSLMSPGMVTDFKSAEMLYNNLAQKLRDLSAYRVMNFSPLEMRKGGFGEGLGVGMEEFFAIQVDDRATTYQMAQSYDEWVSGLSPADQKIANKGRYDKNGVDRWFNTDGSIKEKWTYGVGYQTPFWLRLSGEMALTEFTFGGAIAGAINTLSKFSKTAYITSRYGTGAIKQYSKAKKGLRLYSGSFIEKFTNEYSAAAMHEFSKLYIYNKTFAKEGGEMPYAFTILGPAGVAYGKYMQSLFKRPPLIKNANGKLVPDPARSSLFQRMNYYGMERIPMWQSGVTMPFREGTFAAGSATLLGVGTSFEEIVKSTFTDKEFNTHDFLHSFSLNTFTQNAALSLIMRGTAGTKAYSEMANRYKADVAYIRSRKAWRESVKNAEKNYGIFLSKLDKTSADLRSEVEKIEETRIKSELGEDLYQIKTDLQQMGFDFGKIGSGKEFDPNTKQGRAKIKEALFEITNNLSKDKKVLTETFLNEILKSPSDYKNLSKMAEIVNEGEILLFEQEFTIFTIENEKLDGRDKKFTTAIDNFLANKLTTEDVQAMASMASPDVFVQLLKDRNPDIDQPTMDALRAKVEDAMVLVETLVNEDVPLGSIEAKEIIEGQLRIQQLDVEIANLKTQVSKGTVGAQQKLDLAEKNRTETLAVVNDKYNYAVNDAAQIRAAIARDMAIIERAKSGGQVILYETREKLEKSLQEMIDNKEIDKSQIPDLIDKNGNVSIPDNVVIDAFNLISNKTLNTGQKLAISNLFIDARQGNINIDLHEGSHPIINVLLRKMGIKRGSAEMNKFVTNFRQSIPNSLREAVDRRLLKELNIDVNDPKSMEGKDLTEYFTRFIEEVQKRNFDIKELYTENNIEAMTMLEDFMGEMLKGEVAYKGGEINFDLGVNFLLQITKQAVEAKANNAFGPNGEFVKIDAFESLAGAEVEDGYMFMQASETNSYKQSLVEKKEVLDMLKTGISNGDYQGPVLTEMQRQVETLQKEIKTIEKNIDTSDKNYKDVNLLKELDVFISEADGNLVNSEGKQVDPYQKFAEERGLSLDYVVNLEKELVERNIGVVNKIYNGFPKFYDSQNRELWQTVVKEMMVTQMKSWDPSKSSLYNHLQVLNKRLLKNPTTGVSQIQKAVEGQASKEQSLTIVNEEGKETELPIQELQDNTLEEITNNIDVSIGTKTTKEQNATISSTNSIPSFNSENGSKSKARIIKNTNQFIQRIESSDYINPDGSVNHKKFYTDFNKNARSGDNNVAIRNVIKKPTEKSIKSNREEYEKELETVYNWLTGFAVRNPQIIKNLGKRVTGEVNWASWVDYGDKMNVSESLAAGTSVKNVKAGNKKFVITPISLQDFYKMMIDQPMQASNPTSALEAKYNQIANMLSFDISREAATDYINNQGKVNIFDLDGNVVGRLPQDMSLSPMADVVKILTDVSNNPIKLSPEAQFSFKNLDKKQQEAFEPEYKKQENQFFKDYEINQKGIDKLYAYRDKLEAEGKDVYSNMEALLPGSNEMLENYEALVDVTLMELADMPDLNQKQITVTDKVNFSSGDKNVDAKLSYRTKAEKENRRETAPYWSETIEINGEKTKIHFVNPEVWERERGYSEMLAGEYATTGDISANHLTGQDRRSGIGRSDLYNYEVYKNTGELVPYEKYSGVTSSLKGKNIINAKLTPKVKKALTEVNSIGVMNNTAAFIQFGEFPTNAKGETIKKFQGPNGGYVYKGKEYLPTLDGRIALYDAVFTAKESKARKVIFEHNYNVKKKFLEEVEFGSEEYNNRLLYLSRVGKEGANLRKGTRNQVWNIGMVITPDFMPKLLQNDIYVHTNGIEVEVPMDYNTKVEHFNPNVAVESAIVNGVRQGLTYEQAFGDFTWTGAYGANYGFEVIDKKVLPKSGGTAQTLGGGFPRVGILGSHLTYFRGADGKVRSVYDNIKLETGAKKSQIEQGIVDASNELKDLPPTINPIEYTTDAVKIAKHGNVGRNKKAPVNVPADQPTQQGMVTAGTYENKYDGNGNLVYQASSQTTRRPNETGEFSSGRKAIITMGAPGSGKTTLLNAFMQKYNITSLENINMDIFKEELRKQFPDLPANETEYNEVERSLMGQLQALAVKEKNLSQSEAMKNGNGMAIDMTGASYKTSSKIIKDLQENGYEVFVLHADVSKETSLANNKSRGQEGNRSLPDFVVETAWNSVNNNLPMYKDLLGENFFSVNTELVERGTIPEDVAESLYNKANANEIIKTPPAESNPALGQYSVALSNNVEAKKKVVKDIMSRNIKGKNLEPMSEAEIVAAKKRLKYRFRFMPNSFSHLSLLNSRFFKYREDYEQVDAMINGTFDKEQTQYDSYKVKILNDFKGLNKQMKNYLKANEGERLNMNERSVGAFTTEDAIRVYCWTKNGFKPKGLSDKNIVDLNNYVVNNKTTLHYAEKLMKDVISGAPGGTTYFKPSENWQSGSIYTDLTMGVKSIRPEFFKNTAENIEIVYGNGNLQRMALEVGDKSWEGNVQGILNYMLKDDFATYTDPTTRKAMGFMLGYTRLGLVGSVRSMIGQLTSSTLFLGYGRGVNPFTFSAKNLKEFGKNIEELRIFTKGEYFQGRGQNFDLVYEELQNLQVRWQSVKNKSVALSFAFSSLGDRAAIAMGAFYVIPQRIDRIMKKAERKGNPITLEEARKQAHEEFIEFVENTQQSRRANRIGVGQKGVFGKISTGFLNAPIRYNNNAMEKLNKSMMKSVETGTFDIKKSGRDLVTFANYIIAQGYIFTQVQDGVMYTVLDDDLDPDKKTSLLEGHRQRTARNQMETIVNSTGTRGKLLTTIYKAAETFMSEDPKQARKDGVDIVYEMIRNFAPALGVRGDLIRGLGWDIKDIKGQNLDADGDGEISQKEFMPYLRASTKVFALLTNAGIPKEIVERMDDYEFIMAVRTTFWQKIAVLGGQSPWMVDKDIMQEVMEGGQTGGGSSGLPTKGGYNPSTTITPTKTGSGLPTRK